MDMTLRWYGEGNDSVTLDQIRQIPGVTGVITALHDIPAGEAWTYEDVMKRKQEVEAKGLKLVGVESINVHEDIKIGLPTRDELIENYCKSLEAIGKADIHLVCYNFMPVFDWTRTDLAMPLEDGSTALAYDSSIIDGIDASEMFDRIEKASGGFVMPGWDTKTLMQTNCVRTINISWMELFLPVKNTKLKWQFTRTIRLGMYSDFHVL